MPAQGTLTNTITMANPLAPTEPDELLNLVSGLIPSEPAPLESRSMVTSSNKTRLVSRLVDPTPTHQPRPNDRVAPWVDTYIRYRGRCPICAGDARHRILDALCEYQRSGESPESLSLVYGYPHAFISRIAREAPYTRSSSPKSPTTRH